jgi:hypothetical protein
MNDIQRGKGAIWKKVVRGAKAERQTIRNTITIIVPDEPTAATRREMRKMGLI